MVKFDRYTYRVFWSAEDSEFVATVAEFPSLSWLDSSQRGALDGLLALAEEAVADMEANGEPLPVPFGERAYSGKFQVRVAPEVHRRIAIEAAEEGVSLNRLVAARL